VKSERSYVDYLRDILEYAAVAGDLLGDMSLEEFEADRRTHLAVIRALEIIGEAARQVPDAIRRRYPEVPWADVIGMRHKVIHGYFGVDLRVVWETVHEDLPPLREAATRMLEDFERRRYRT